MQFPNMNLPTIIAFVLISTLALGLAYKWTQKGLEWTE